MAYTIVSNVKAYLGITTAADDTVLAALVNAAASFIDAYTNRRFEAVTGTVLHTGADILNDTLWLQDDLLTLTAVKINGENADTSIMTLLGELGGPYHAIAADIFAYHTGGRNRIEVTGQWGYSAAAPDDIAHACTRLAAYYYRQRDAQVFDTTALPEAGIITVPRGLPQDVRLILDRYRRLTT